MRIQRDNITEVELFEKNPLDLTETLKTYKNNPLRNDCLLYTSPSPRDP